MHVLKLVLFCMIFTAFASCRMHNAHIKVVDKKAESSLILDGYVKASVLFFPDRGDDCKYLIRLEDEQMLETFDLPDSFKQDRIKIWLKFGAQKRMSLCDGSNPVAIIDIKKREE